MSSGPDQSRSREHNASPNTCPTYLETVSALTSRYPILQHLNFFVQEKSGQPLNRIRVAVLEFRVDAVFRIDFGGKDGVDAYNELRLYLASTPGSPCQHRLYLLEDLHPAFIELLGEFLNVDGTVFASQIRDKHYSGGPFNGHAPKLPSFQDPASSFTLRYYEARYFDHPDMPAFSSSVETVGNVRRQITFGRRPWRDVRGHVGHIRRNTSFWSQKHTSGAWNGAYCSWFSSQIYALMILLKASSSLIPRS